MGSDGPSLGHVALVYGTVVLVSVLIMVGVVVWLFR